MVHEQKSTSISCFIIIVKQSEHLFFCCFVQCKASYKCKNLKFILANKGVETMSAYEPQVYFTGNGTYKAILNTKISKVGDFTPFYIAITICSIILGLLLILNVVCCCSRYSDYWLDRHTGNRWLVSIWSATPHKQPPLDFTELESQHQYVQYSYPEDSTEYREVHRHTQVPSSVSRQPLTASQEYLELHKRESDI